MRKPSLDSAAKKRLLTIDDDPDICEYIGEVAEGLGFEVRTTSDPDEFREHAISFEPSVVVLDLQMPRVDGVELLRFLGDNRINAQVLVVSGMDTKVLATAEELGASRGISMLGSLQKPLLLEELEARLNKAIARAQPISEADLEAAIANGEIAAHYQPIAGRTVTGSWTITGAEVLARWHHPSYGMILPDNFIPLAEESGLIAPLTDYIFRMGVKQLGTWQAQGLNLNLSLNLSTELIDDLKIPDRLEILFREFDVDISRITLELTESAAMRDPEITMDILTRLRVKGVNLAIDDFGTGYSSLRQLYRMPFNELKIDISFVKDLGRSDEAKAIVDTMIYLAHRLGMESCAEGVESQAVMDYLHRAGCDRIQGFFISEAVEAAEMAHLMTSWRPNSAAAPADQPDAV